MSSRLVQGIAAGLGVAALVTAAFTQSVTPPPASTIRSGEHATYHTKPITFGLIPAAKPKPTTQNDDADTPYDYINPCSLIPLSEIRAITGNHHLKYIAKHGSMTTDVANAQLSTISDPTLPKVCVLDPEVGYVKPTVFVGIMTQQSTEDYMKFRQHWNTSHTYSSFRAQDVDSSGLPGAREVSAIYSTTRGGSTIRYYTLLFVHTKDNQTLIIKWSGSNALPVLRQLAYEALRTLNGSRYPGK